MYTNVYKSCLWQYGHGFFDTISVYRATDDSMRGFENLGVPRSKVGVFFVSPESARRERWFVRCYIHTYVLMPTSKVLNA
jgi:hypothetical protein